MGWTIARKVGNSRERLSKIERPYVQPRHTDPHDFTRLRTPDGHRTRAG